MIKKKRQTEETGKLRYLLVKTGSRFVIEIIAIKENHPSAMHERSLT